MNRVLFRGKRIDNNEWVYGYYVYTFERGYFSQGYDDVPERCHYIDTDTRYYEVYPESVGQFTGLKDKKSSGIFEGDILMTSENIHKKVTFMNGCFKVADIKHPNNNLYLLENYASYCYIIGNMCDNKKLIEEIYLSSKIKR